MKEVVSHVIFPPPGATVILDTYINKETFEQLSSKNQKILQKTIHKHVKKYSRDATKSELRDIQAAEASGVTAVTLPPEDVKEMKKMGRSLWNSLGKRSKNSQKIIDLLKEFMKEKGIK